MKLPALARIRMLLQRRHWAVCAAFALLAVALVSPSVQWPRTTFSYMVTFDVTQSMDTEDLTVSGAPMSRLAYAKAAMRETLAQLPCGSRIGWSIFAGQSTLPLMPPLEVCANFDALLASLDGIDGRMRWANWSRIAEGGVYSAIRVARDLGHGTAVVFITDGQEAPPILPGNGPAVKIALPGIGGWLIGVGGDAPAPIPKTDERGNRIGYWLASEVVQIPPAVRGPGAGASHEERSELRGRYLADVAGRIGFGYRRLSSPVALAAALRDARWARHERAPESVRWIAALAALVLLVWRYARLRDLRAAAASASRAIRLWILESRVAAYRRGERS